ncbi:hypothetical protein RIF29_17655 [Crotalaria pallida]|uniref:PGG domain-containing protein n=1 Tax=Crotalaria pallida TaxID=3830 RepID=A0AAN9FIH4_CROPI
MEGSSLPTSVAVQHGALSQFTRYQNDQSNWMEQMRGNLMLVATVIATMNFQIAINPPGGVWQSNTGSQQGCAPNKICKAGTSVLAFGDTNQVSSYEVFLLLCTISFSVLSVYCTAGAYEVSIMMVTNQLDNIVRGIITYYWAGLVLLLGLMRGNLMLVATVIATVNFQIAVNPPGGVWQSDTNSQQGCAYNKTCKAGTSVLAFANSNLVLDYEIFILLCTISFSASLTIILLLICGFPLSNRLVMWLLVIAMIISVTCTAGAYVFSISMVMHQLDSKVRVPFIGCYILYWVGLVVLIGLILSCRLIYWLLKKFLAVLLCKN